MQLRLIQCFSPNSALSWWKLRSSAAICRHDHFIQYQKRTNQGRREKGTSGNQSGRPAGSQNKTTQALQQLLEGEAERITRKAIDLALAGDLSAIRLCRERLLPPRKDRPVQVDLPPIQTVEHCELGRTFGSSRVKVPLTTSWGEVITKQQGRSGDGWAERSAKQNASRGCSAHTYRAGLLRPYG